MKRTNSDVMVPVVQALCESIGTPRALSVWLCFKYNQRALLELPATDPATNDTRAFLLDYFITEYLSKYKGLKAGIKTRDVAVSKWRLAEQKCYETNLRFRGYQLRPFTGRVEALLYRAQRKIAAVLGSLNVGHVLSDCRWGPGATFDLRRSVATPDNKISRAITVTAAALPYLRAVVESDPHWASVFLGCIPEGRFSLLPSCFEVVKGSRISAVAKNAKTDRIIAVEPTGNSFLQQGVHKYMRRRLMRFGIDLDDQSINNRLAQEAYTRELSTLDLSAASDTISRELVYHLLPLDWSMFLDSLRSPATLVDEGWVHTEKFASMGNAFCFELETLIFWALASSVESESGSVSPFVSVYGDDIIVSRWAFDSVVEILQFAGFEVNSKKSFKDGNFFESCGKHYHRGVEVTPAYQKEILNHPSELIRAHNRLIRLELRSLTYDYFRKATKRLCYSYPLRPFPRLPIGSQDDGGFLRPLSDFLLDKNHGFRCHVLAFVPKVTPGREDALYAYYLRRRSQPRNETSFEGLTPLNPDPRGYAGNVTEGTWRTKVRWVPEASVLSKDTISST